MNDREKLSPRLRFQILERDRFTCRYCGRSAPEVRLEVDHVHPVSKNGSNGHHNLVTSCFECNRAKHASVVTPPTGDIERASVPDVSTVPASRWPVGSFFFSFSDDGRWEWAGKIKERLDNGMFRVVVFNAMTLQLIGDLEPSMERAVSWGDMARWEFMETLDDFGHGIVRQNARLNRDR